MVPTIQNKSGQALPLDAETILQAMFDGYQWVFIHEEFGGGRSGSRVFLVQPIRNPKRAELPVVVKMAAQSLITKEWSAYQNHILDKLPRSAKIKEAPICPPEATWGGLRYEMVGDGTFDVDQFANYIQQTEPANLYPFINEQLLKALAELWSINWVHPGLPMQSTYDAVLPVNLLIEPKPLPKGLDSIPVTPDTLAQLPQLKQGDYVQLTGFVVTKVDLLHQTVTLNLPKQTQQQTAGHNLRSNSYIVRLRSVQHINRYQFDTTILPLVGQVVETRGEKLTASIQAALSHTINLSKSTLQPPGYLPQLPNPLVYLPKIVEQVRRVRVGTIHGDLNLGNILVDKTTSYLHLIDFSEAREDYVLHDLLRLETEVITHIVAKIIRQHDLPTAVTMWEFYQQLYWANQTTNQEITFYQSTKKLPHPELARPFATLMALRQEVNRYLFLYDDEAEYYQGLVIYLIGALKFRNLDHSTKLAAFWGAAVIQQLILDPPPQIVRPTFNKSAFQLLLVSVIMFILLGTLWQRYPQLEAQMRQPTVTGALAQRQPSTNTITASPTMSPSPTIAPTNKATSTYTPRPTATQTSLPIPTPTTIPPSATSTPTTIVTIATTTPTVEIIDIMDSYPAPKLIAPKPEVNLTADTAFIWQWEGKLAPNHGFEVRIWRADDPHYGAYDARETMKDMQQLEPGQYSLPLQIASTHSVQQHGNSADYFWAVAIVQLEPYQDIGIESSPRPLQINVFGGGSSTQTGDASDNGGPSPPGPLPSR